MTTSANISTRREGLLEIADQVLRRFQADIQPDQPGSIGSCVRAGSRVRHDQAGRSTPAVADAKESKGIDELRDTGSAPFFLEHDREHAR